jgi:hypothetical protein
MENRGGDVPKLVIHHKLHGIIQINYWLSVN